MVTSALRSTQKIALGALFVAIFGTAGIVNAAGSEQVDLTLEKAGPSGSTVAAGSTIQYTLTATNKGPDTAFDVTVTDLVPSGLTFNGAQSDPGCVPNGSQVHCHVLSLPINTTVVYTIAFDVTTNSNFCGQTIENTASVSTSSTELNPPDNQANTVTHTIDCSSLQADVAIDKNGPSTIQLNDTIVYQLTVTNLGPGQATGITASDTVPTGLTYNQGQSSNECVLNGPNVHCDNTTLAPGATQIYNVAFDVNDQNSCGRDVLNTASVSTQTTDPNSSNNVSNTVTTRVECPPPEADLRLAKTGPATAQHGELVTYALELTNLGPDTATSITVEDVLPVGMTFKPNLSDNRCSYNSVNNIVECTLSSLPSSTSTIFNVVVEIQQALPCDLSLTNSASATSATHDPNSANNDNQNVTTTVVCPSPTLTIRKTDGRTTAAPGEILTYNITIENTSGTDATNVEVLDHLPTEMMFLSASDGGLRNNGTVGWNNLTIPANGSKVLQLEAKILPATPNQTVITNTAIVVGGPTAFDFTNVVVQQNMGCIDIVKETFDANNNPITPVPQFTFVLDGGTQTTTNNSAGHAWFPNVPAGQHTVTEELPNNWELISVTPTGGVVNVQAGTTCSTVLFKNRQTIGQTPTFTITKTDNRTVVAPGETLTYNIVVTNTSAISATNVTVTDALPSDLTFQSANENGQFNGTTVTWSNLSLNPSQSKTLTITAQVNAGVANNTVLSNTATITGGPSATDTTTVNTGGQASFSISKTDGKTTASPEEILTYTITVTNTSTTNATNVQVVDTLPSGLQFISAAGGGTSSGQLVTWNIAALNAGQTITLTVSAQVESTVTDGTTLTNIAQITGGPLTTDITTVTVSTPTLTITKTDNKTTAQIGEVLTYNITINNTSTANATDVSVQDTVPSQLSVINATIPGVINGQTVTWDGLSINGGGQLTLSINAQVRTGTANNTILTNTAQIIGGNSATDSTTVQSGTGDPNNVTIDLTDLRDPVEPDETFCYNIRLTNLNTTSIDSLTVTQSLDSQTEFSSASDGGSRSGNSITWRNISIPGSGTRNLGSCVRVDEDAEEDDILRSTAFVGNKSDEETTDVEDDGTRDGDCRISSIDDNPDPVEAGETLTYNIRIRNERNRSERFNIRAFLDGDVSFLSASDGGDDIGSREVEWDDFRISSDETDSLRLTVRVKQEARDGETIRIRVDCEDDDDVESTRIEGGVTRDGDVSVSVDKNANRREAKPGDTVFYSVNVRNNTNRRAQDVSVQDRFTSGSISIEDAGGGRVTGNGINWTIPTLNANETRTFTYRIRVGTDMRHGQIIANTVRVTSPDLDRDATDIEEVRVITDLPQTGLGGFFNSWQQTNQYLRPSTKSSEKSSSAAAAGLWTTIISIGTIAGGVLGRRYLI